MTSAALPLASQENRRKSLIWNLSVLAAVLFLLYLARNFRWDVVWESRAFLLRGLGLSWELALVSVLLGMAAAIPLAAARLYAPWGLRHLAIAYIEVIRAVPPLMLIYWVFFTTPALTGSQISPYAAGVSSLFMMASAYLAEVIRAGLISVPATQIEGGLATGLSAPQVFLFITLPQALRNMVPAVIAQFISLFKTTSLVYVVGLVDFFRAIIIVNNAKFAPYALYATMAIGYFVCCYLLSWLIRRIDPTYQLSD